MINTFEFFHNALNEIFGGYYISTMKSTVEARFYVATKLDGVRVNLLFAVVALNKVRLANIAINPQDAPLYSKRNKIELEIIEKLESMRGG